MKNHKGFTLIEIVIVLGLLAIIGGVAAFNIGKVNADTQKIELHTGGKLFAEKIRTCIKSVGGWSIKGLNGTDVFPCHVQDTNQDLLKEKLKTNLGWNCPKNATCKTYVHGNPGGGNKFKYYCLSIQKEINGKKYQVIVRVYYMDPSIYQIWCGNPGETYLPLQDETCKKGIGHSNSSFKKINILQQQCN